MVARSGRVIAGQEIGVGVGVGVEVGVGRRRQLGETGQGVELGVGRRRRLGEAWFGPRRRGEGGQCHQEQH